MLAYKEKVSGVKADLILCAYALFSRFNQQESSAAITEELTLVKDNAGCTYSALFFSRCSHLPWSTDLRGTPSFSFIQLCEYLVIRTLKFKHINLKSTSYKKLKAFQFVFEGYIKKLLVAKNNSYTFFDVRMKASMRSSLYKVLVILSNSSGDVCGAACTCPAGAGLGGFGNCNHVGGVLFALEDFNRKGYQGCPEPVSCTSRLSAWNVPTSFVSVSPASIDEVFIQKIRFGKDNKFDQPKYLCYDPRRHADRQVDRKSFEEVQSSLASCLSNSCFFAFHSHPAEEAPTVKDQLIITETVPSLSAPFVHSTVTLTASIDTLTESTDTLTGSVDSQPFSDAYDISCNSFKEMMHYYCQSHLNISDEEIQNIEEITCGQAANEYWQSHRLYRITASNFYSAIANSVEPSSKIKSMFYLQFYSASTEHGKYYESHVRPLYRHKIAQDDFESVIIDEPGLIVSKSHPYLAASLDGIVKCKGSSWGLEIKCPSSHYNSSLAKALDDKRFFLSRMKGVQLKRSHRYFYQIQAQMFCTGLTRVDLVVWFGDKEPLFVSSIKYDEKFIDSCLGELKFFYCRAILPEFFTKRVQRGLKLYLHGGWESSPFRPKTNKRHAIK